MNRGLAALALIALLHPLWYVPTYGGDGIIHLVFAKNWLAGHAFQFNPGEVSGGETSAGFMLICAALLAAAGPGAAPLLVKAISVAMIYALGWLTARLAKAWGATDGAARGAGLALLGFPGVAYAAQIGTENGWFAVAFAAWLCAAHRAGWPEVRGPLATEAALGAALGLAYWLRPEAAIAAGLFAADRAARGWRAGALPAGRLAAFLGAFAVPVALHAAYYHHHTGLLPFSAGVARLAQSRAEALSAGGLYLSDKVLVRLLAYAPLLAAAALGVRSGHAASVAGLVAAFFAAYAFVLLPTTHFARYSLFLWPAVFAMAAGALARPRVARLAPAGLALFVLVAAGETWSRRAMGRGGLAEAIAMGQGRLDRSESLLERLGRPTERPVVVACQEVQIRWVLDDRFVVRSLDGITDLELARHITSDGWYDHDAYLAEKRVRFLLDLPNYNRDRSAWSLASLAALPPGQSTVHGRVRYTRLPSGVVGVETPQP